MCRTCLCHCITEKCHQDVFIARGQQVSLWRWFQIVLTLQYNSCTNASVFHEASLCPSLVSRHQVLLLPAAHTIFFSDRPNCPTCRCTWFIPMCQFKDISLSVRKTSLLLFSTASEKETAGCFQCHQFSYIKSMWC